MSSVFIVSAIKDLLPSIEDPPKNFVAFCQTIYSTSKINIPLPSNYELGRIHLAVIVAIFHYQEKYHWEDPIMGKIPIPKKNLRDYISRFATLVSDEPSTPTHTRIVNALATPNSSGRGRVNRTPRGKAQLIPQSETSVKRSLTNQLMAESTYSGSNLISDSFMSPPPTPTKRGRPAKSEEEQLETQQHKKSKKLLTSYELVTFCNKFYIPEHLTQKILNMFYKYRANQGSSWGFLVGLVGIVYYKLNVVEITNKLGLWTKVVKNLHRSQNGGLTHKEVDEWVSKVTNLYGEVKWIREAEFETTNLVHKVTEEESVFSSLGSFTNKPDYLSGKSTARWENWCKDMKNFIS